MNDKEKRDKELNKMMILGVSLRGGRWAEAKRCTLAGVGVPSPPDLPPPRSGPRRHPAGTTW